MKHLIIKLTDEEYNDLVEKAKREGYSLLSDYVRYLLMSCSGSTSQRKSTFWRSLGNREEDTDV
jgi:hypothetical protein